MSELIQNLRCAFSTRALKLLAVGGAVALIAVALAIRTVAPFAASVVQQWAKRDMETRSRLIFDFIAPSLKDLLAARQDKAIVDLFSRVEHDERILSIGYCDNARNLVHHTKLMPTDFSCNAVAHPATPGYMSFDREGQHIFVASFPVPSVGGNLVVVSDLSHAQARGAMAQSYFARALAAVILLSGGLAVGAAMFVSRWQLAQFRRSLALATAPGDVEQDSSDQTSLDAEVLETLRRLGANRSEIDDEHAIWTADTIRMVMRDELPGADVIAVSNREPYIHIKTEGGVEVQTPASGLVSALEPVMKACGGTWIAHGGGAADRQTVDANDRIAVPPSDPSYTLRRVWLSDEEVNGYYYGLANEGLWPLCHIAFVRPNFRLSDWRAYQAVNRRFADAVVREARTSSPIVLIHDYHFALLPRLVRERLPDATIVTFWHIPWPNSESFGVCPWREEVIAGLLGSSILGFHTRFHCNNFLDTVDRYVESRINRDYASVTFGGRETLVRPYPISIEWPPAGLPGQKPVEECRAAVRERLGLAPNVKLAVGVERFDYTKGIPDRLRAVDIFLTQNPQWRGKFVFLQAAAPTRGALDAYHNVQEEAVRLAAEINTRHAGRGPAPIRLVIRHHEPSEVFELLRAADLCIVSSLHDGMNLVAKEFVAARDDERGVLLLSSFAGASRELFEALIVNPFDANGMSAAIERALSMSEQEQRERMRLMREHVRSRNVYRWAGQMLLDASRLRKRQRIVSLAVRERTRLRRRAS